MFSCCFMSLLIIQVCVLHYAKLEDVKIIRASDGDQFSTTCCNCCNEYKAFCSQENFCHCRNGLSYYNKSNGYSCFTQSEIIDQCSYEIRKITNLENFFFYFSSSNIELGILVVRKNLNLNTKKCNLNSIHHDAIPNWTVGDISDFQLVNSKKTFKLVFKGNPTKYYGKLLKLTLTCDGETSCLMLKVEGEMIINTDFTKNEIVTTMPPPQYSEEKKELSKWMLGLIIGVALVIILVIICVVVYIIKRKERKGKQRKSKKSKSKKSKEALVTQTDGNRNSIHDQVAMYISHEDHVEISSAYVDPDAVFNKESSKKIKNPNYDYAYTHHNGLLPRPGEKHEYMDIDPDHPYDKPAPLPCPDSRKSLGYAILKGVDDVKEPPSSSAPSEYQALTLEKNDNPLAEDEDRKSPGSPKYFQLDDDHRI